MKRGLMTWGLCSLAALPLRAQDTNVAVLPNAVAAETQVSESLQREALAAVDRGIAWLIAKQDPAGYWSNAEFPALTALPLWALLKAHAGDSNRIQQAVGVLLSCAHTNGAIFREPTAARKGGGLPNYNTAVCMVALNATGDPALAPVIRAARAYLARSQLISDTVYSGGMGYDPETGRDYTDLSNSYMAYEAMRLTGNVDQDQPAAERHDLNWEAARGFIQRTQNDPDFNKQAWVSDDPAEKGGFVYHPEQTRSGAYTNADGVVKFRSMRGMTYAGLLSYIYAEVQRDDPRIQATIRWIVDHWTLDANNRAGADSMTADDKEGLYYLYNVMAKGMAAYGQDVFTARDGRAFNWRVELIERLLALQKIDDQGRGYWVNEVSRYWEGDPVLVTAYSLLALEVALQDTPSR